MKELSLLYFNLLGTFISAERNYADCNNFRASKITFH